MLYTNRLRFQYFLIVNSLGFPLCLRETRRERSTVLRLNVKVLRRTMGLSPYSPDH